MRSGEIMKKAEVTRDTIRHYVSMGLIKPAVNKQNGYKEYSKQDLENLIFIKNAKIIGFSLDEIKKILEQMHSSTCKHQSLLPYLHEQLEEIDYKIISLKKIQKHLRFLIKDYGKRNCAVKPSKLKL